MVRCQRDEEVVLGLCHVPSICGVSCGCNKLICAPMLIPGWNLREMELFLVFAVCLILTSNFNLSHAVCSLSKNT